MARAPGLGPSQRRARAPANHRRHLRRRRRAPARRPRGRGRPPHLAEIRAALVEGRHDDAIAWLSDPAHARDALAQVLLGNCLAAAGRHDEALAVLDRAAGMDPAYARVSIESLARVLEALGRTAEAEALHRALLDASTTGSDLRVRL